MPIRPFACCLLLVAASSGAATGGAQDAKALEVIAAARKAIGNDAPGSLDTLSVEAGVQRNVGAMQITSEVEILLDLPDKFVRTDQGTGPMAGTMSVGFDGDTPIQPAGANVMRGGAVMIRMGRGPGGGPDGPLPPSEKLTPEEQARADTQLVRMQRAEVSRLMLGWFASAHPSLDARYAYAGEAESPDGKAHVVDVTAGDGFSARLFIDQQTHLPLMVTYRAPQPRTITLGGRRGGPPEGRRAPTEEERAKQREDAERRIREMQAEPPVLVDMTLFFDDWRDVGGLRFPHNLRRAAAGTTNEEWTVTRVRVNPKIDPGKFKS